MKEIAKGVTYVALFAVPFVVLIMSESLYFPFITGKNFTFRILVEIALAAWVVLMLLDARYRPRFSWIAATGLGFLAVMLVANLTGEYPPKSVWSNFERMDGYVTLLHFYAYFLVLGSMLTSERLWNYFFNTTIVAALILSFYGFAQISGNATMSQGGWRIDATLGNSTYMAIYMLFHIAIAGLMYVRSTRAEARVFYGVAIALFTFLMLQTGTRGAILGLVGGLVVAGGYLAILGGSMPRVRKTAVGVLLGVLLLVGGFIAIRDAAFVSEVPVLKRMASITLEAGSIRFMVWDMALEGVAARPALGWGQGAFNYVFNEYYNPELYRAEPWYDRVHNIVLDWAIAGGVLGVLAYFSIYAAALYYLVVRPLRGHDVGIPLLERSILIGVGTAYLIHNLFVFDNVVSYIFFAVVLAFLHQHVSTHWKFADRFAVTGDVVRYIVAPVMLVLVTVAFFFLHLPQMRTAHELLMALRTNNVPERFEYFERALARDTFGNQEVVEQMTLSANEALRVGGPGNAVATEYADLARQRMTEFIEEKPGDARLYLLRGNLERSQMDLDAARASYARARELTPTKTDVIIDQGIVELLAGETDAMLAFFETAYELAPAYERARFHYAIARAYAEDGEGIAAIIPPEDMIRLVEYRLAQVVLQSTEPLQTFDGFLRTRVGEMPSDPRTHLALFSWYARTGRADAATELLDRARAAGIDEEIVACAADYIDAPEGSIAACVTE